MPWNEAEDRGRKVGDQRIAVQTDPVDHHESLHAHALCGEPPQGRDAEGKAEADGHGVDHVRNVVLEFCVVSANIGRKIRGDL